MTPKVSGAPGACASAPGGDVMSDLAAHPALSAHGPQPRAWSAVRFPLRIGAPARALRLARPWDLPALYPLFGTEIFLRSAGRLARPFGSLLSFWRWLRGLFCVVYLAEVPESGARRVVGFVGLYDLEPGRAVSLSMAIFDPADRRRGYGAQSVETLCLFLGSKAIARVVCAEVLRNNTESLGFLRAVRFEVCGERDGRFLLERHL